MLIWKVITSLKDAYLGEGGEGGKKAAINASLNLESVEDGQKKRKEKKYSQSFKSKEEFKDIEHKRKPSSAIGPLQVSILELPIIKLKKYQCLMLLFSLKAKQMSSHQVIATYMQAISKAVSWEALGGKLPWICWIFTDETSSLVGNSNKSSPVKMQLWWAGSKLIPEVAW